VPDGRVGWIPFAKTAALKRIARGDIDVIVTTGPPHSTHLAGLEVSKKTSVPWLADLRDPWTNIYYNHQLPRTAGTKAKDLAYETSVLQGASAITVVSPGMADEFGNRAKRTKIIYNGYDTDDIPKKRPQPYPEFTLSHIGNFFPSMESAGLIKALKRLIAEEPTFASHFKLRFTGLLDPQVQLRLEEAGLAPYMEVKKPVPHKEAVLEMMRATMLLFSIPAEGNVRAMVTGKVFEYLATGLPILALGDDRSGAAEVLIMAGQEKMCAHEDGVRIFEKLQKRYHIWLSLGGTQEYTISTEIEAFSRRNCTQKLSRLLDTIAR
jgi:glycosyltransferase involved in cell wall biosynthesis